MIIRRPLLAPAAALMTLAAASGGGCGENTDGDPERPVDPDSSLAPIAKAASPVTLATARRVNKRYGETIFDAFPAVVGHGVGAAESGSESESGPAAYVIIVFMKEEDDLPDSEYSLDGVPLQFEASGSIVAE